MIRKSIVLFTVFAFIFGMAGMALAANRIEVKVTSEPVPLKSECSKAGGFSLEFDEGSLLVPGDELTIDTDFGVTLCESFDMIVSPEPNPAAGETFIQLDAAGNYVSGLVFDSLNTPTQVPAPATEAAFTQTVFNDPTTTLNTIETNAAGGVAFRIRGQKGTQRITVTVVGPLGGGIRVIDANTNQPDVVTLNFLGERTNGTVANATDPSPFGPTLWFVNQLWEEGPTADFYNDSADWDDNTLCIDVSSEIFTKSVVNANMDSRNDIFTFIPSNPQIAHVAQPLNVSQFLCKGSAGDNILIPDEQAGCSADYESGSGYCSDEDLGRRIVIANTSPFDVNDSYRIRLEILNPSDGVYWGAGQVGYEPQNIATCPTSRVAGNFLGVNEAFDVNGNPLPSFTGAGSTCTIANNQQATTIITNHAPIFAAGTVSRGLWIDLPNISFETGIAAGTNVQIRVTLEKFPCGTIFASDPISLGVFGCDEAGGGIQTLIYPYFTELDSAISGWWNGIVVTNLSSTEGTATFHLYESDGDQATLEQTVVANSAFVTLLEPTLAAMTPVVTGDGVLGNSTGYIIVCTDFLSDGFAMIANNSDSDVNGSESMGYLPRYDRGMSVCTTP